MFVIACMSLLSIMAGFYGMFDMIYFVRRAQYICKFVIEFHNCKFVMACYLLLVYQGFVSHCIFHMNCLLLYVCCSMFVMARSCWCNCQSIYVRTCLQWCVCQGIWLLFNHYSMFVKESLSLYVYHGIFSWHVWKFT